MQRKVNTRYVSTLILAIMLMSSTLAFLPYTPAITHAQSSSSTPVIALSITSGYVGDWITVTGTGFPSMQLDIDFRWYRDDTMIFDPTLANAHIRYQSIAGTDVSADANGYFKVQVRVPIMRGGAYTLRASYDDEVVIATFTVLPRLTIWPTSGYVTDAVTYWTASGYGPIETVSLSPVVFTVISGLTGDVVGTNDGYVSITTAVVADIAGGLKTVTATGAITGRVATATFTVLTGIWMRDATDTASIFSIRRDPGYSVGVRLRGFVKDTVIPPNSITIGGASTAHSGVTIDDTGTAFLPVTLTSMILTIGPVPVVIAGITFSFPAGNIRSPGGVLIASVPSPADVNTAVIWTDRPSYGVGLTVTVFGAGFKAGGTWDRVYGGVIHTPGVPEFTVDPNGAFYYSFALPATAMNAPAADRRLDFEPIDDTDVDDPAPLDLLIVPRITRSPISGSFGVTVGIIGYGFRNDETISITIAGRSWITAIPTVVGGFTVAPGLIDVGYGVQTIRAAGPTAGNVATISFTVLALAETGAISVDFGPIGTSVTLDPGSDDIHGLKALTTYDVMFGGEPGVRIGTFRSTADGRVPAGVRVRIPDGLYGTNIIDIVEAGVSAIWGKLYLTPGEQYTNLLFNINPTVLSLPTSGFVGTNITISGKGLRAGEGYEVWYEGIMMTTFTSTALGRVPVGVVFTVPPDITAPGSEKEGTPKLIQIFHPIDGIVSETTFTLFAKIELSVLSGPVGTEVTVTGSGWAGLTAYAVIFGGDLWATPPIAGRIVATFTSTADGDVPPDVVFTIPLDVAPGTYWIDIAYPVPPTVSRLLMRHAFTVEAVVPVAVFDSATFRATTKTDKPSYKLGEEFKVIFGLKTTAGSLALDYVVTAKAPDGSILYPIAKAERLTITTTLATITVTYALPTTGALAQKGTWTVLVQILDGVTPIDIVLLTFTVT